jgi:hypothetical protein
MDKYYSDVTIYSIGIISISISRSFSSREHGGWQESGGKSGSKPNINDTGARRKVTSYCGRNC